MPTAGPGKARLGALQWPECSWVSGPRACGDDGTRGARAGPRPPPGRKRPHRRPTVNAARSTSGPTSCARVRHRGRTGQGLISTLPCPAVIGRGVRQGTELHVLAAEDGLAVVYPQGVDAGWGDDGFATPSRPAEEQDVISSTASSAELRQDPRIGSDPIRHGRALERCGRGAPLRRRASGCGAGRRGGRRPTGAGSRCRPSGRVPLLAVHGTADPVTPFRQRRARGDRSWPPGPDAHAVDAGHRRGVRLDGVYAVTHRDPEEVDPDPDDENASGAPSGGSTRRARSPCSVPWSTGGTPGPGPAASSSGGGLGPISQDIDASADAIAFVIEPDAVG